MSDLERQKHAAFIIPYFGKFNGYFQLFLNSCAKNPTYDWIIFTDDKRHFQYPDNVIVHDTTFADIKALFRSKFSFDLSMDKPYKLCDYKPAYGYVFAEYLKEYPYWGECDTDLIFGDIDQFLFPKMQEGYDKIGIFGHCTLYRNTEEVNTLFLKKLNGKQRFQQVAQEYWNHSFDEEFKESINDIFEQEKKKICYTEYQANIYTKSSDFRLTTLNADHMTYSHEPAKKAFFAWEDGKLYRYLKAQRDAKTIEKKEFLYIHMQSRPMKVVINEKETRYKIIPNSFDPLEAYPVTSDNFSEIKIKHFNLHYFRLRSKNLWIKIKKKLTHTK